MSMRALVTSALLAAGCTSHGSVTVELTAPASATRVALYFSVADGTTTTIAPAGFQFPLPTTAWTRDTSSQLDVRDVSAGDEVAFELARGSANETKLTVAIVVAFGSDGRAVAATKLKDLAIPTDRIERHVVVLEPVGTGALDVFAWGPKGDPDPQHTCVVYGDHVAQAIDMVVTDGDPDCDGFVSASGLECVDNKYMAVQTPVGQSSCLVDSTVPTTSNAALPICELGGPSCTDGVGPMGGCTSSKVCLPHSVCTQCMNDFACAADLTEHLVDGYPTHLNCRVGKKQDGTICGDEMLAWPNLWSDLSGRMCFGDPRITRGMGWSNQITGSPTVGALFNVEVKNLMSNCNFTVKVTGTLPPTMTTATGPLFSGLVAGALDNGRGVAIPVMISYDPAVTCGAPPACNYVTSGTADAIFECANAAL